MIPRAVSKPILPQHWPPREVAPARLSITPSGVSMQDGIMIWVNAAWMGAQRREPGRKCITAYLGLAEAKQFEMLPGHHSLRNY